MGSRWGGRGMRRWAALGLAALVLGGIGVTVQLEAESAPAFAAEPEDPEVYRMQAFADRIDDDIDELRADFVLRVPHGYVDPATGDLLSVGGQQIRIGYDYGNGSKRSTRYINTISGGLAGADRWAKNQDEYFTIHSVISSGKYDFLVISVEGDLDIPANAANNIVGGLRTKMNWYFSYASGAPSTSVTWTGSARTVEEVYYFAYYGNRTAGRVINGPQIKLQWDSKYSLWSNRQANWGQVLDFGLNGFAPGILPPNAFAVDLVNNATASNPERGAEGTVSDSFWYAWVHEDGSLVTSVNTAPIRVTGVPPRSAGNSPTSQVSKNIQASTATPQLGWSIEQAEQGLTDRVGFNGSVDFTDAGGTGYYRFLVWPEARDPREVTAYNGAPRISYEASDLFDANGQMTQRAEEQRWPAASVYYGYSIPLPEAPVITTPADGSYSNVNGSLLIEGTGTPGHTLTLKLSPGTGITNTNDPALTTIVDGDHEGVEAGDVLVGPDGTWRTTYVPPTPFPDGPLTVVALQTDQSPGNYALTSPPSNPNSAVDPTSWGVTVTIDTVAPDAPGLTCPATNPQETTPTLSGSGVEPGAAVTVFEADTRHGDAIVAGAEWSYTVAPELGNGSYAFTATQTDRAGNESPPSAPPCVVTVALSVSASAQKEVPPLAQAAPGLEQLDPSNWEITLSDGSDTVIMNGPEPVELERDTRYTVAERPRSDPAADPEIGTYAQLGALVCLDGDGAELPSEIFDPAEQSLMIPATAEVAEPVTCTLQNQTAHLSLVTLRLGGQPGAPGDGWSLAAQPGQAGTELVLDEQSPARRALPGDYALTATVPEGLSPIGVQQLKTDDPECAARVPDPTAAPERCWAPVEAGETTRLSLGEHRVLRIVAAAPHDLPSLPITGGLGTLPFVIGGVGALLACTIAVLRRRALRA